MNEGFVTDTHPLLHYFCNKERKLSRKAKQVFTDTIIHRTKTIYVPSHVILEISLLVEDGVIELTTSFETWVESLFRNYPMLLSQPFDETTAIYCHHLKFHNDPFDKAMVATALQLALPLITNDSIMHDKKPCLLLWD